MTLGLSLRAKVRSWFSFSEPSRLETLKAIYDLPVIRPEKKEQKTKGKIFTRAGEFSRATDMGIYRARRQG